MAVFYFVVTATAAELALRTLRPDWVGNWSERSRFYGFDSVLGWKGLPHVSGTFKRGGFAVTVTHNRLGFRDPKEKLDQEGRPNIVVLGDSYVWGYGVEQEALLTTQLEKKMHGVPVINMGVSGYGSDQELLLFETIANPIPVAWLIVIVTLPSDFDNNTHSVQYGYSKPYFTLNPDGLKLRNVPVPADTRSQKLRRFLVQNLAIYNLLDSGRQGDATNGDEVELTARILERLDAAGRQRGARSLFVINPSMEPSTQRPYQKPNVQRLARRLARAGLDVIDLTSHFQEFQRSSGARLTLARDPHWNPETHRRVAQILADHIGGRR